MSVVYNLLLLIAYILRPVDLSDNIRNISYFVACRFPHLASYVDRMLEMPAVKATYTDPQTQKKFVQGMMNKNPQYDDLWTADQKSSEEFQFCPANKLHCNIKSVLWISMLFESTRHIASIIFCRDEGPIDTLN